MPKDNDRINVRRLERIHEYQESKNELQDEWRGRVWQRNANIKALKDIARARTGCDRIEFSTTAFSCLVRHH